jgi:hypothetical protein
MKNNLYSFKSITVLLPVINEEKCLIKTIEILLKNNKQNIKKIFFILDKKKTQLKSKNICRAYLNSNNKVFSILYQKKKSVGGAFQDSFIKVNTTHCLIMSSDFETNPISVKKMIKFSQINPRKIITASRWKKKGGGGGNKNNKFLGYGYFKILANFIFQKFFSFLYRVNCTDLTFGFRIFPTKLLKIIKWEMTNHSFFFETIIKPIKIGVEVLEVETNWKKRDEGVSSNYFTNYFYYLYIGFKVLFLKNNDLIKKI